MYPVLYTPATTPVESVVPLINGSNPDVHRMVVCTEDSVNEADVPLALANLQEILGQYNPHNGVEVFIRARNWMVLDKMLEMPSVENLTGFVIPKVGPQTFSEYTDLLEQHDTNFRIMPILESKKMAMPSYRTDLLQVLMESPKRSNIDCLRIGGNDLMGFQGIRRDDKYMTIYDTVIGTLIGNIVNEFRITGGFEITAPVFECYGKQYDKLLRKEVRQSVLNQMLGQTVIHPRHIPIINELYKVRPDHLQSALEISGEAARAVTGKDGKMDEKTTHARWATSIILRSEMFGVVTPGRLTRAASAARQTASSVRSTSRA